MTAPASGSGAASLTQISAAKAREYGSKDYGRTPWATDRATALGALLRSANDNQWPPGSVVWITDGLASRGRQRSPTSSMSSNSSRVTMVMPAGTRWRCCSSVWNRRRADRTDACALGGNGRDAASAAIAG